MSGRSALTALVRTGRRVRRWPTEARLEARDRALFRSLSGRSDLRINVGSSSSTLDGWINVDIERDPEGRCVRLDATTAWPFPAASAEAVNSEHFIEHVSADGARAYLSEAFRVLRPGGVIRTSTPDLSGIAEALGERDARTLEIHRSHGYEAATHGELVNNYVYSFGHRRLYDEETLALLLREAGFVDPQRRAYGESRHEVLRGIDRHDPEGLEKFVLCLDAAKPD